MQRTSRIGVLAVGLACLLAQAASAEEPGWKIGVGRREITPKTPLWMAGYSARNRPSEGAVHPLWAKALAFEDAAGTRSLLVTLDLCGIDRALSLSIRHDIQRQLALPIEGIVLSCSHTHCGPVAGSNLITMYPLNDEQHARIADYTRSLQSEVVEAATEAFENLSPARLERGLGRCGFAVNRRNNDQGRVPELRNALALAGPDDHDVPVLVARNVNRTPRAIAFGYACHCTTLDFNQFCGDYAGFAQVDVEQRYPGCTALFWAGCGADQNPLPRRTLELAAQYGKQLADAVAHTLEGRLTPVSGRIRAAYSEISLAFDIIPDRAHWESMAASDNRYEAERARLLLKIIEKRGALDPTYPYPIQAWRLGDDLTWIFLGGEVVVDYALRLKRNLGSSSTWVAGYCNDVMAYIPTRRVWDEGGYEGGGAMLYYGLPTRWSANVEDEVIAGVDQVLKRLSDGSGG